jgi:hypothetical protein
MDRKTKMNSSQQSEKQYPTWEILGLVIGFVGSANMVPD